MSIPRVGGYLDHPAIRLRLGLNWRRLHYGQPVSDRGASPLRRPARLCLHREKVCQMDVQHRSVYANARGRFDLRVVANPHYRECSRHAAWLIESSPAGLNLWRVVAQVPDLAEAADRVRQFLGWRRDPALPI